jgi:hypothetical protein
MYAYTIPLLTAQHLANVATDGSLFRSFLHETIQNNVHTNKREDYKTYMGREYSMVICGNNNYL